MANLFFVFTPLQLLVAQQIVYQEQLKDCILIEGHVQQPQNTHFYAIYDYIEIEGMWKKKIIFPQIAQWDGLRIKNVHDIIQSYKNYRFLKNVMEENNVEIIYLGEIQNQAYRFTDILFSHHGYKIAYFEDGLGHYMNRKYFPGNTLSRKVKVWLRDIFYYLPIYHVRFARWRYNVNIPNYSDLHIFKRYSVIPVFHESYDVHLIIRPLISNKVKEYIEYLTAEQETNENVLLLTDPLKEYIPNKYYNCYLETIKEYIEATCKDKTIYIKYHPREKKKDIEIIESIIKSIGRKYVILGKEINIPVELFLQTMTFKEVLFFNAATYFYNGYLFPKCNFVPLLPIVYKKCQDLGSGRILSMEMFIHQIENGMKAL